MKNNVFKKSFNEFLFRILITTVLVPLIFLVFKNVILSLDFNWFYEIDSVKYIEYKTTIYGLLFSGVKPILLMLFFWVIFFIYNVYMLISKCFKYSESIINSIDQIFIDNDEYINIPGMVDIEQKFNNYKWDYKKSKKDAIENEQKKDELIVYLAHDIKTPLTSMIGYLSILDEIKDMPDVKREKYINISLDKAYRLEDLINELFDIARFNASNIVLQKEKLDLKLVIEQVIDDFYPILIENNKNILLNMNDEVTIYADSQNIGRVFNNLIKNAINYSTEEDIKINVYNDSDYVLIDIINKGREIPKEKLDLLFLKFYRLDSSRNTKSGGSGLGLAIAKEIIELHNGFITAESINNTVIFHVRLPKV